jgi:menaquinol-cytochrome c reductase iron-sulfur subunit
MEPKSKTAESSSEISRRKFLTSVIVFLNGVMVSILGWNIGRYFISPAWKLKEEGWINLGSIDKLSNSVPQKVIYYHRKTDGWMKIEGVNAAWLLRENNQVIAFNPKCTHLGCAYRWDDEKNVFACPCHTAIFSRNGDVESGPPPRPLDRYPIKINSGEIMILPGIYKEEDLSDPEKTENV